MTKDKMTVKELTKQWYNTHCENLAESTKSGYRKYCNLYVLPTLGNMEASAVLQSDIQALINKEAEKGLRSKTQRNIVGVIHSIFQFGLINKIVVFNPAEMIKCSKTAPYEYHIFTQEQYNELVNFFINTKEVVPILLAGICGMRLSEIMGLKWSDINFEEHTLRVTHVAVAFEDKIDFKDTPKSAAGYRTLALPQIVVEQLLKNSNDSVYVYKSTVDPSQPENGRRYYNRFRRLLQKAGLPHTRFHDLRHFAATEFLDAGVPDKYAAAYLGHSDTNMTKKYQHIRCKAVPYPMDFAPCNVGQVVPQEKEKSTYKYFRKMG